MKIKRTVRTKKKKKTLEHLIIITNESIMFERHAHLQYLTTAMFTGAVQVTIARFW